jgi:hypothetical protein
MPSTKKGGVGQPLSTPSRIQDDCCTETFSSWPVQVVGLEIKGIQAQGIQAHWILVLSLNKFIQNHMGL